MLTVLFVRDDATRRPALFRSCPLLFSAASRQKKHSRFPKGSMMLIMGGLTRVL